MSCACHAPETREKSPHMPEKMFEKGQINIYIFLLSC